MNEEADTAAESGGADEMEGLKARAANLERQLAALQEETRARLVQAELRAEAMRAGIVDLDGLRLLDPSGIGLRPDGAVEGAATLIARLKRDKPWLFAAPSSSPTARPPLAQPPRQKMASEMTDEEYRAARAALLKRRG